MIVMIMSSNREFCSVKGSQIMKWISWFWTYSLQLLKHHYLKLIVSMNADYLNLRYDIYLPFWFWIWTYCFSCI